MKKYFSVLFLIIWIFSIYSCSDLEIDDPFANKTSPELTITNTEIIGSTILINWQPDNEFSLEFSYMLEPIENTWSDWTSDLTKEYDHLDEGLYEFNIKSRYEEGTEQSAPDIFLFEIDAITGPALRFYPLYKEVSVSSPFIMEIYVEAPIELAGAEIEFSYDKNLVDFTSVSAGALLASVEENVLIGEDAVDIERVLITLATAQDGGVGLSETGPLVELTFTPKSSGTLTLDFDFSLGNGLCPWHEFSDDHSIYIEGLNPTITKTFQSLNNAMVIIQ